MRLVAAMHGGEALWVAFEGPEGLAATGAARGGTALAVRPIGTPSRGYVLLASEAVPCETFPRETGADRSLATGPGPEGLGPARATFDLTLAGIPAGRIALWLAPPDVYEAVTGSPAPPASSESDAYRGWRLP